MLGNSQARFGIGVGEGDFSFDHNSVWQIRVFSGLISNPTGFNHSEIAVLHCSMIFRSLDITTKSSAYLIRFTWTAVPLFGYLSLTSLSIPNSAMLASSGLITPP